MIQETLFQDVNAAPETQRPSDEDVLCAIAVSAVSSPGRSGIWDMMQSRVFPGDIYRAVSRINRPVTQEYLVDTYSDNPATAARMILDAAAAKSIRVLTFWDEDYPALLKEIQCPPVVLYIKGDIPPQQALAIVGARRSDARSAGNARRIAREAVSRGCAVVSGMAVGIDREAHLGAIEEGGRTIGVLANGIDIVYPWPNRDLYRLIESTPGSALVSEYPPGIMAGKWTFVRRNRIISGLCAGTVVVKAGRRSGALITARHAMEQNRDVFACTGNSFDEEYAGCHGLIKNGAVLVSGPDDIFDELSRCAGAVMPPAAGAVNGDCKTMREAETEDDPEEGTLEWRVLRLLKEGDREIDAIAREIPASPGEVNEAVVLLELGGRITRSGNMISRVY
ncbi:MAG: DNA-processing protein DprA [Spirochaetes bacterium]|nr:DNA-processing protein DprA [Spirochaetota bacterium]